MHGNWFTLFLCFISTIAVACQQETLNNTASTETSVTSTTAIDAKKMLDPAVRFEQLFIDVQMAEVFSDEKTFVNSTPKLLTDTILARYAKQKIRTDFDLKAFVFAHFDLPKAYPIPFQQDKNTPWESLLREPNISNTGSLISLPRQHIASNERLEDVSYWDSYFTILSLQAAGKTEMIEQMADNFAYLIDSIGFIPQGNRTYYLGRSQPPFFAAIIQLLAENGNAKAIYQKYLPALEGEYAFWMDGADGVVDGKPYRRVVRMPDGSLLNRYWDDKNGPRSENYREDVELAEVSGRNKAEVYKHLRASSESAWSNSARWLADEKNKMSIETTHIIPIDLNSLLYHLEKTLSTAYEQKGDEKRAKAAAKRANNRKTAIYTYLWDKELEVFNDYHFINKKLSQRLSVASVYPFYFKIATTQQAQKMLVMVDANMKQKENVLKIPSPMGQKWNVPNGWLASEWLMIKGLENYGFDEAAEQIRENGVLLIKK